jgi:hypothetical protein
LWAGGLAQNQQVHSQNGGRGGIRTHGGLAPTPVFKTGALNRSATLPNDPLMTVARKEGKGFQRLLTLFL